LADYRFGQIKSRQNLLAQKFAGMLGGKPRFGSFLVIETCP
jgi:hypothetical protein